MAKAKSNAQVRKIWAAAKELGLDDDGLHDVVAAVTGQRSVSVLTRRQAREVIDKLELLAGRVPNLGYSREAGGKKSPQTENVIYIASPAERDKIQSLAEQLGWTEAELVAFTVKMYKRDDVTMLRRNEAHGIICAMESMMRRRDEPGEAQPDSPA